MNSSQKTDDSLKADSSLKTDSSAKVGRNPTETTLTSAPIGRTLVAFSLPILAANILQSLNGSINAMWVSHVLGESALTATANANLVFFLMLGAVFGVAMAANIMIAQAVGAKNVGQCKKIVGSCISFFAVFALAVGIGGIFLAPHVLDVMETPPAAHATAVTYLRIIFAGTPFICIFTFLTLAQRGAGDSRTPFYFAVLQVLLDIVLNPALITGWWLFPRMGIAGSATATLLANIITLAVLLVHLYRRGSVLALRRGEWHFLKPDMFVIRTLLLKGLPMGAQLIVNAVAAVLMMSIVNQHGLPTATAYSASIQLWNYVVMPALALSAAISAMTAQNVGAGRMDRVERIVWVGIGTALIYTAVPVVLILIGDNWVLRPFLSVDSAALPIAQHLNHIVLWSFLAAGMTFAISGVVRATGAVWPPLLALIFGLGVVRVPFASLMAPHLGADAIWLAFPVGDVATLTIMLMYFRWGRWRNAVMLRTARA